MNALLDIDPKTWNFDPEPIGVDFYERWFSLELVERKPAEPPRVQPQTETEEQAMDRIKVVVQLRMCYHEQRQCGAYPGGPLAWALEMPSRPFHELIFGTC